ncbi:MAG: hypothetical protein Q4P05_02950 [Actinomycetaceae bacterium]|nr:hypothetical protein [Actinomycetaceae bacterium]
MHKIIIIVFYFSLGLFLVMGAVLVLAQGGSVAAFEPDLVTGLKTYLGPPTFMMSALCAVLAFALSYTTEKVDEETKATSFPESID